MVAGDPNGAARRRLSGSDPRSNSSIEGAFVNANLPFPPGSLPLWRPGGMPGEWSDVCGFLKPPGSEYEWQVRLHGAFTILYSMLGLKETDQSCHHEVWIHLHLNARLVDRVSREDKTSSANLEEEEFHRTTTVKKGDSTSNTRPFALGEPADALQRRQRSSLCTFRRCWCGAVQSARS